MWLLRRAPSIIAAIWMLVWVVSWVYTLSKIPEPSGQQESTHWFDKEREL